MNDLINGPELAGSKCDLNSINFLKGLKTELLSKFNNGLEVINETQNSNNDLMDTNTTSNGVTRST